MLQKPCPLKTDGRTDRQMDGRTDEVNPVYPPPTSLGGGIITFQPHSKTIVEVGAWMSNHIPKKFLMELLILITDD